MTNPLLELFEVVQDEPILFKALGETKTGIKDYSLVFSGTEKVQELLFDASIIINEIHVATTEIPRRRPVMTIDIVEPTSLLEEILHVIVKLSTHVVPDEIKGNLLILPEFDQLEDRLRMIGVST